MPGVRSDISYVKGIHNMKAGVTYPAYLSERKTTGSESSIRSLLPSTTDDARHPVL